MPTAICLRRKHKEPQTPNTKPETLFSYICAHGNG